MSAALFNRAAPVLEWLQLDFGRELDPDDVLRLLTTLLSSSQVGVVVFETERSDGVVTYRVGSRSPKIANLFEATVDGCVTSPVIRTLPEDGLVGAVRANTRRRPLRTDDPAGASLRLLGALATTSCLVVIHQVVIARRLRPNAIPSQLESLRSETWPQALIEAAHRGRSHVDTEARRALARKEGLPGALVTVRVLATGPDARAALRAHEASCRSLETPGLRLRLQRESWGSAVAGRPSRRAIPLNCEELLGVLSWPYGERSYPGLHRGGARLTPVAQPKREERVFGLGSHPGTPIQLGQSASDALRHTHIIGPTGVGKSTLLLNLIVQDIAAGRGVVVLDPKGDLIDDVLARTGEQDVGRVVVLDASRTDHVVGFNPLRVNSSHRELAVDGVLHVFHQLYADSWGPRTQDILHSALLTLVGTEFASICHIPRLLVDDRSRRHLLTARPVAPAVRFFWSWFEGLSDAERGSVIAPVMNKLRPFLLRSSLRALLGQIEPLFDPMTIFTERRVLLVPLRAGLIGAEAANLLGSLLVAHIWQLAQQRSAIDHRRRHPVLLYLDEFQDYLHLPTNVADVLAQARSLGLGLVMAHQHLGQLGPTLRDAVLANAQSRICFRLGADDAKRLARGAGVVQAEDFMALKRYEIYASLLDDGATTPFASARTLPPAPPARDPRVLGAKLAKHWGRPPSEVDEQLASTEQAEIARGPVGRKKRGAP